MNTPTMQITSTPSALHLQIAVALDGAGWRVNNILTAFHPYGDAVCGIGPHGAGLRGSSFPYQYVHYDNLPDVVEGEHPALPLIRIALQVGVRS